MLGGRNDKESKGIIFTYLDNKDSSVRYWTVDVLKGSQSSEVLNKLIEMLEEPEKELFQLPTY